MTGSNNPYLCIGGPRDGKLMAVETASNQVHVRELACPVYAANGFPPWEAPLHMDVYSHVYYKATFAGELFLIHETLHGQVEYPRNVFARLKSNYKVFE